MLKKDMLHIIDSIYQVDCTERDWLSGICTALAKWHSRGHGTMAWTFRSNESETQIGNPIIIDGKESYCELPQTYLKYFGASPYGAGSTVTGQHAFTKDGFTSLCPEGISDFLSTIGFSPDGLGVIIGSPSEDSIVIDKKIKHWSDLIAAHLANAFRLRIALTTHEELSFDPEKSAAIFNSEGKLLHSNDEYAAKNKTRQELREAIKTIDRAKSSKISPDEALSLWKALVSGRWSLLDHFESDGRRFVVALKNPPALAKPRKLSERERQVAAYCALGYSGKQIAYVLGIDASAVSRTLNAVVKKLNLRSSTDLVSYFSTMLEKQNEKEN